MAFLKALLSLVSVTTAVGCAARDGESLRETCKMMYDFRTMASVDDWIESSDTVRTPGKSKAALVLQKTREFQRAIFFTLLNPQPNGAGFAGVASRRNWNLQTYAGLELRVRAQGESDTYKVVLYHKGQTTGAGFCAYEVFYTVPLREWVSVQLPFEDFKPYFRGAPCNETEPLDPSAISSVGLQIAGGVYRTKKQMGASSLEIDYIRAYV